MTRLIETIAMAILLILAIMALMHMVNGTFFDWIGSKFQVKDQSS